MSLCACRWMLLGLSFYRSVHQWIYVPLSKCLSISVCVCATLNPKPLNPKPYEDHSDPGLQGLGGSCSLKVLSTPWMRECQGAILVFLSGAARTENVGIRASVAIVNSTSKSKSASAGGGWQDTWCAGTCRRMN